MVLLDAYASLRWSEVVALKRDDLDLDGRTVRVDEKLGEVRGEWVWDVPKTSASARVVDLPDLLVTPLAGTCFDSLRSAIRTTRAGMA